MAELPLLRSEQVSALASRAFGLSWPHIRFADAWLAIKQLLRPWKAVWALSRPERLRQRVILEAVVSHEFGLSDMDVKEILKECDFPVSLVCSNDFARKLDPKGFWRYEKEEEPEKRLAVLTQVAREDLRRDGLKSFLSRNDGEGWMLPETLRLADYGLGHDDRAKEHQPVSPALGPRFYPWQLEQSVEESWEECERHAEVLARLLPPPDLAKTTDGESGDAVNLFGNHVYVKFRNR